MKLLSGNTDTGSRHYRQLVYCLAGVLSLFSTMSVPAPAPRGATPAQVDHARALAHPVLHNNGSDVPFMDYMQKLLTNPHNDIMAILYFLMKESIEEMHEDKKYYLEKLKQYNAIAEAYQAYLEELAEASRELAGMIADDDSDRKADPYKGVEPALQRLETALARTPEILPADRQHLERMLVHDHRYFINARRLQRKVLRLVKWPPLNHVPPPPEPVRPLPPSPPPIQGAPFAR